MVKANHNSAIEHSEFVQEAIAELLRAGCVVECMSCPHVCSPLHVAVIMLLVRNDLWLIFVTLTSFCKCRNLSMKV